MKTTKEIEIEIRRLKKDYKHVLTGGLATIQINAPRALQQLFTESKLYALHWALGTKYESKLKGIDT